MKPLNINKPTLPRKTISLALPSLPLPAGEHFTHSEKSYEEILNTLNPNQITEGKTHHVYKASLATPAHEALALLWKNFPTPNTRALGEILLERWAQPPEKKERKAPILLIGNAGTGKTSTTESTAKLVFGRKSHASSGPNPEPIIFAAGGRNLDELLIEPWFNEESEPIAKTLMDAYNGIAGRQLSDPSRNLLKEKFPEAFTEESLDLFHIELNAGNIETLSQIAEFEGILKKGSTLGVELRPGALIQAVQQGRILIVDEADKAIPGAKINEVLQAIAGRIEHPVEFSEKGIAYTFSRENIHRDFDLILAANNLSDGGEIAGLRESTLQRFRKIFIQDVNTKDITERIAQKLIGFNPAPLQAIKASNKEKAALAEEIFRTAGTPLSEQNLFLIRQLDKTLQACRQLAACIRMWGDTVDPQNPKVTDPVLEDNRGIGVETPAVRFAQSIIEEALVLNLRKTHETEKTQQLDPETDFKSLLATLSDPDDLPEDFHEIGLGEKIEHVVAQKIAEFPAGEPTKTRFHQAAINCAILPEPDEESNLNPQKLPLIRDLLNTLQPEIEIEPETQTLQKKLCDRLREKYSEARKAQNEQLIPAATLQNLINTLTKPDPDRPQKEGVTYTIGLNPNYLKESQGSPIQLVPILTSKLHAPLIREFKESHGMTSGELLDGLQHPSIRKNLLSTLWIKPLEENENPEEEVESALEGGNPNLRIVKVLTRKEDQKSPEFTLIVHSKTKNTLVAYNPSQKETIKPRPGFLITGYLEEAANLLKENLAEYESLLLPLVACHIKPSEGEISRAKAAAEKTDEEPNPIQILLEENTLEELIHRACEITTQRCPIRVPLKLSKAEMEMG